MKRSGRSKGKKEEFKPSRRFGVNIVSVNKKKVLPKLNHEVGINISLKGLLIKCTRPLKRGTKIGLDLMLAKEGGFRNIAGKGKVVRCYLVPHHKPRTYYLEVQFLTVPAENRRKISWFLRRRSVSS